MASEGPTKSVRPRRKTNRKRRLRELLKSSYEGQAVLLDELRWAVMGPQFTANLDANSRRSLLNSFARTVREQLEDYEIQKLRITTETPVGVVARVAVYRMNDGDAIRRFLNAKEPCILCRYKTNFDVFEPRYEPWSRYLTPQHHAATFRFFEARPSTITYEELESVPGTYIPATHKLSLVVPRGTTPELESIAAVPWKLYGYDGLNDWGEVKGCDPLGWVHRNRYW